MIAANQDPNASNAYQDTRDLCDVISHPKENEGDDDDRDDSEKVNQLGRQYRSVSVGKDGEVVTLHVQEGEDNVFPAIFEQQSTPAFEAITVKSERSVDDVEQDIVEEGLKGWDGRALCDK